MQLCDLYENDCIFDKFDCCVDGKGEKMATGSYSNLFSVIPRDGQTSDVMLEASRDPLRRRLQTVKVCVCVPVCAPVRRACKHSCGPAGCCWIPNFSAERPSMVAVHECGRAEADPCHLASGPSSCCMDLCFRPCRSCVAPSSAQIQVQLTSASRSQPCVSSSSSS